MEKPFTKAQLIEGHEFCFENEQDDVLEVWHKNDGPNWVNPFQWAFNGEFFSLKTFESFEKRINKLITDYNLKKVQDEEIA